MAHPVLHSLHMLAPCLVQSLPVWGLPFGHLHTFAVKASEQCQQRHTALDYTQADARAAMRAMNQSKTKTSRALTQSWPTSTTVTLPRLSLNLSLTSPSSSPSTSTSTSTLTSHRADGRRQTAVRGGCGIASPPSRMAITMPTATCSFKEWIRTMSRSMTTDVRFIRRIISAGLWKVRR